MELDPQERKIDNTATTTDVIFGTDEKIIEINTSSIDAWGFNVKYVWYNYKQIWGTAY